MSTIQSASAIPDVLQETLARIGAHKGVLGVLILHNCRVGGGDATNHNGGGAGNATNINDHEKDDTLKIVHSTWPPHECERQAPLLARIARQAQSLFPMRSASASASASASSTGLDTANTAIRASMDNNTTPPATSSNGDADTMTTTTSAGATPNNNDNINHPTTSLLHDDALSFVTIRSHQREILIAPDGDYLLVVLQNPHVVVAACVGASK